MTGKRLGAKPLDYATDMLEPIVIFDHTEREKQLKQRIIDALNDCPKNKAGYLVIEMKDKGDDVND